jgi:hypothetical protein
MTIVDRYLQLMQEVLVNAIYQDRAMDPWSHRGGVGLLRCQGEAVGGAAARGQAAGGAQV